MSLQEELELLRTVDAELTRQDMLNTIQCRSHGLACKALTEDEIESYHKVLRAYRELKRRDAES